MPPLATHTETTTIITSSTNPWKRGEQFTHIKLGLVDSDSSLGVWLAVLVKYHSQVGSTNLSISTSHRLQDGIMEEDVLVLHTHDSPDQL